MEDKMHKLNPRIAVLLMLASLSLLIFTSCENDIVSSQPSTGEDFNSPEYAILDFEDAINTVQGGTVEEEFFVAQPYPGDQNYARRLHPMREGRHLGLILRLLELTDEQKELVRIYLQENRACVREAFDDFKAAITPILRSANEERKALIEQYRNGEITNEELYFALQELREQTKNEIENNADVQAAKLAICDCKLTLLDNIGSILTEDQLTIWNDWVDNLDGPCFEII